MVVLDSTGAVCQMNAAAETLLGENGFQIGAKLMDRPLEDGSVIEFEGRQIRLNLLKTDQADYVMLTGVEERNLRESPNLEQARELLAVKAKSTARIVHEFGTPLSAIRMKSYLLRKHLGSLLTGRIAEHLEQIDAQLDRMVNLLDDLLLLNHVYEPQGTLLFTADDLEVFCRTILEQIGFDWEGGEVILTCSSQVGNLRLDRRLIRYMLATLVGNALKHSPKGGQVGLDVCAAGHEVVFTISANHLAIRMDEVDKIFTQGYRTSDLSRFSGVGVDLAVMKTCIEMYGGSIHVESALDETTIFTVTLPSHNL
jgi:signal transduction histidine kinase